MSNNVAQITFANPVGNIEGKGACVISTTNEPAYKHCVIGLMFVEKLFAFDEKLLVVGSPKTLCDPGLLTSWIV